MERKYPNIRVPREMSIVPVEKDHVVFILNSNGTPEIVPIGTSRFRQLQNSRMEYCRGTKQECDEQASALWETISDGAPHITM
jgi:hypothetical protein